MTEPDYTLALHHQRAIEAAQRGQLLDKTYVLAKHGQIVYCATLCWPYTVPNGPDCWTMDTLFPERTRLTIPCRHVIACNPALCSCLSAANPPKELSACEVPKAGLPHLPAISGVRR